MRIMAIDYGDAHTGIAVSDPTGFLAGFTTVIDAYRPDIVAERIALLAREHGAERLVLGHPINMDGTRGPRSEKAQAMRQLPPPARKKRRNDPAQKRARKTLLPGPPPFRPPGESSHR